MLTSINGKKTTNLGALISIIGAMVLPNPAFTQDHGLHNSSKRFTEPAKISWLDWSDPREMERTWRAAAVRIPTRKGQSKLVGIDNLQKELAGIKRKIPTVIYLHGCSGFWHGTHKRTKFLADSGFLVITPASFARKKYPKSCDVKTNKGGLYRGSVKIRQNDAGYAIEMARKLSLVDGDNIVLIGFSEGGVTAATFEPQNQQQQVRARIVESWTCNTPWSEYRGVNAPVSEPVLTLVAERDPWYQNQWTRGDCTQFLNDVNGSRSIIYRGELLGSSHALLEFKTVQDDVLEFLKNHLDSSLYIDDVQ